MFADLVLVNGQVITSNMEYDVNEAVAVTDNQIVMVGTNEEVKRLIGSQTEVVDLAGRSLVPGFIDSHLHITLYGTNKLGVSCKEPTIESLHDVLKEIEKKVNETPIGKWVRAWGFNQTKISENRYPSRKELDLISSNHPIILRRACGHISVVNSKALELAGIDEHTTDPEGGIVVRDEEGVPTGVLIENAQMPFYELADFTHEELLQGLMMASNDFTASGITSIHDAGVSSPENFRVMQEAVRNGKIQVRVYAIVSTINKSEEFVDKMIKAGISTGLGDEKFKIGPAKVFTDGSSSGPTAAMREPYTDDSENSGILYFSQEELNRILGEAHEKGFQITAHAQGDRAIEMMLNCIDEALKKHPRKNHRHRIEHAGITMPDLVERMRQLEVIPIPNPAFFLEYGDGYMKSYGERVNHMYPVRDFLDKGIIAAGGSDSPVTSFSPLLGIHGAVNRKSSTGQIVGGNQRIGVLEAIKLFTWNGAYASFEENIKGSIEIGKLADLVVLNGAILDVPTDQIKDMQVDYTIIGGKVVFQKESNNILSKS
ncbi:amidohydrolase [Peribacillus sp. ACCC06369]|uniref:amidohydrolase n=1 Tax=Peribacillus sp. ACCC06369 TaxID=3055860 RepID=UPI0025A0E121|nr:amidohydrolase [Peribacillus sp. ACCC06369]MDM5358865.1 amidohydrolase [Peribacillus sp. ACCC06369]